MPELKTGNKGWWLELKQMGYEPPVEGDKRRKVRDESIEIPLHALSPEFVFELLETAVEEGKLTLEEAHRILEDQGFTCIGAITITTSHTQKD